MAFPSTARTTTVAQAPAPAPARVNRMTLAAVTRGIQPGPVRLVLHGTDGVGKSTFGADAPGAIFLPSEDGTRFLDVARLPTPESWQDHLDALDTLTTEDHPYQTLVWDSLDHSEAILHRHLMAEHNVQVLEEIGGGFGKWVNVVTDEWRKVLARIERLQRERKMGVILIAHSQIRKFSNPEGPDFERYQIKLADRSAALFREWADTVGFCQLETFAAEDKKTKKVKGVSTGARLMHVQRTAAFDAKDRTGLPDAIALSWPAFDEARTKGASDLTNLIAEIKRKAHELGADVEAKALDFITKNQGDAVALRKTNDRLNALMAEKAEKESK